MEEPCGTCAIVGKDCKLPSGRSNKCKSCQEAHVSCPFTSHVEEVFAAREVAHSVTSRTPAGTLKLLYLIYFITNLILFNLIVLHEKLSELIVAQRGVEVALEAMRLQAKVADTFLYQIVKLRDEIRDIGSDPKVVFEYFAQEEEFDMYQESWDFLTLIFDWPNTGPVSIETHSVRMNELGGLELWDKVNEVAVHSLARPKNPLVRFLTSNF